MMQRDPRLLLQSAPFLRRGVTTPQLMLDVIIGVLPVVIAAVYFFGISAVLVMGAATLGAAITEWFFGRPRGASLIDGSAILTGVLLGLTLPPAIPMWMAFLGGAAGIGLGKLAFGGLGQNLFNPALVGRAFLQAAFPTAITTWSQHGTLTELFEFRPSNFALPFMQPPEPAVDAVTTATPLAFIKFGGEEASLGNLFLGNTAGSLGETCAILILLCGVYLSLRRTMDWRIPVTILITVAVFAGIVWMIKDGAPSPLYMLCSGGLLFGAVYMATDPVTSPLSPRGAIMFGVGIGVLVVLIRLWGGLPEAVMYAILLMNAATPLIERITQPRAFGRTWRGKAMP